MIRIKVFPIKKFIYKLQVVFLFFVFLIIIFTLFSIKCTQKNKLIEEVFSKKIYIKSESDFIYKTLKNKLLIFEYNNFQKNEEKNIQISENIIKEENTKDILSINLIEQKKWNKQTEYDTYLYENGKVKVGNVVISNHSKLTLDLDELKNASNCEINDKTNFLLFHTHTSETYTINKEEYSDYYRTQNEEYNMLSVGYVLKENLISKGYNCIHERKVHDYPSYNGAYKSSLESVKKCLESDKFDLIIDIHRDAVASNSNFRPTVEINGESVAKLMFVVGTNAAGLEHDNWMENLKLAIMIQNRAEEMYPGLFRELHLSDSRYNQQVSDGALILEVGATGNTLEEAQKAMKYFAEVIDSFN